MLRLTLAAVALVAVAHPVAAAAPNPVADWRADPGLKHVPTDAFLFVSVKVSKLWDSPGARPVRDWAAAQSEEALASFLGVPPADVERLTLFRPAANSSNAPFLLVTTRKPFKATRLRGVLGVEQNDQRYRGLSDRIIQTYGLYTWVLLVDERTLLFVPNGDELPMELLLGLLDRKSNGPLTASLSDAANHDVVLGINTESLAQLTGSYLALNLAKPVKPLYHAKAASLSLDCDKVVKGTLTVVFPDENTADRAAPETINAASCAVDLMRRPVDDTAHLFGPLHEPAVAVIRDVLKVAKVSVDGKVVIASGELSAHDVATRLVAALPKSLKAVRANREAVDNLRSIYYAVAGYELRHRRRPGDVVGKQANRVPWSWRVQILPYADQQELYDKLNVNKPWNDPDNLKVLENAKMPSIFEHPARPAPKGHTYFRVFSLPKGAKGTDLPLFEEGKRGPKHEKIDDRSWETLMIVEAGEAVPWYKPDVLAYDGKLPLPQLGDKDADLFLAVLGGGTVRAFCPSKLGEKTLRALITRAGGEVIPDLDR